MSLKKGSQSRVFSFVRTLGSTALRAGAEALKKKWSASQQGQDAVSQAALRFAQGLDELKGAAMKAGQLLSMIDEHLLPPGWKNALTKLQSQATAWDWQTISPVLEKEWGHFEDFLDIDPQAVHAASIGQVHKGCLKEGTFVAIKIQYPGLAENMNADLKSLKKIFKIANILPQTASYDNAFGALKKLFIQELDFIREMNFYQLYFRAFEHHQHITVPNTIPKLCTPKVLVTTWSEGLTLQKWLEQNCAETSENQDTKAFASNASRERQRNQIASLLLEVIFTEIFCLELIQSDPNPSNFLIMCDRGGRSIRLTLLDFGATQKLSSHTVDNYLELCRAAQQKNEQGMIKFGTHLEILHPQDCEETKKSFLKMMQIASEPFIQKQYCWRQAQQLSRIHKESLNFMKLTKFRPPQAEILFINRRLGGNLLILEKLGATLSAQNVLLPFFNRKRTKK
jgi:aarF domain-containing kinase